MKPTGQRRIPSGLGRWIGALLLAPALGLAFVVMMVEPPLAVVAGTGAVLLLLGVTTGGPGERRIKAATKDRDGHGTPVFTLSLDNEVVTLESGKTWTQLDHFKWVVRGLIESPENFHVHPDGSVEIYAEKIDIADPEGTVKLEQQINKRHTATVAHKPAPANAPSASAAAQTRSGKPQFLVRLDHWGHLVIEWGHGLDREETGLRGLPTLMANGLIRKPGTYHVDPLQRGIEIDGVKFDCSEAGAKRLEEALNKRYAVTRRTDNAVAVEIKENHAASTGFDIHFTIHRAGVPLEVKGHLSQEYLDILQDPAKCDLLQPRIHLLLSPPYLLIRRRLPDMGEEKIPELPDVNFLHCNAAQLQQALNHPLIRRNVSAGDAAALPGAKGHGPQIVEVRVVRNPTDKALLWLECVMDTGEIQGPKAFTQHNMADLQQSGLFLPQLEVHLSLDHRRLNIQNRQTHQEETLTLDTRSADEDLRKASRMLTNALKLPASRSGAGNAPIGAKVPSAAEPMASVEKQPAAEPRTVGSAKETSAIEPPAPETPPSVVATPSPQAALKPGLDPAITALFHEADAVRINMEVFRRLREWLGIAPQEIRLSRPFVFENRRFEVLSFERQEITGLSQLRGVEFYGFYLSHINEKKVVLVYACNGMHLEWGPDKCVLQPTAASEATEYKGSVLLGLAQDRKDQFVFVVKPEFKQWIAPRETPFTEENLQFLTVADIAAAADDYKLIWPERSSSPPPK
jgi:hypothetical protein